MDGKYLYVHVDMKFKYTFLSRRLFCMQYIVSNLDPNNIYTSELVDAHDLSSR